MISGNLMYMFAHARWNVFQTVSASLRKTKRAELKLVPSFTIYKTGFTGSHGRSIESSSWNLMSSELLKPDE
eukprot:IDg21200t1